MLCKARIPKHERNGGREKREIREKEVGKKAVKRY